MKKSLLILTIITLLIVAVDQLYTTGMNATEIKDMVVETDQNRVSRVATKIVKAIGPEARSIMLYIDQASYWNAFATRTRSGQLVVGVTKGLLNDVNDAELAVILGHEYSHILLGHVGSIEDTIHEHDPANHSPLEADAAEKARLAGNLWNAESRHMEKMADYLGNYLAISMGYNPCAARNIWLRRLSTIGDYIYGDSHPSASQRANYFNRICQELH